MQIITAIDPSHYAIARELFVEYADWLGMDLSYQGFEQELRNLPGVYGAPSGALLLATVGDAPAGCVAVRDLGCGVCEMKRLWVRAAFQGRGVGFALADCVVHKARAIGYERMRLDTMPARMAAASRIYDSLGFQPIPKYYDNPNEGIEYMELDLRERSA